MPEPNIEKFRIGQFSGDKEASKKLLDKENNKIIQQVQRGVKELNSLPEDEYQARRKKIFEETGTEDLTEKRV